MIDGYGRSIDYLRISVTDRCDLRCVYCMPEDGVESLCHTDILRYEDLIRLAGIFAELGIRKIRLTGGEPLVRAGVAELVAGLKAVAGIETVVMTTNGMLLEDQLPALCRAGLDGVNISLDTVEEETFRRITRRQGVDRVLRAIDCACACPGLTVKLNCVPTRLNRDQLIPLSQFAAARNISLRFIELMPIGEGGSMDGLSEEETRVILGEMSPVTDCDSPDKCRYFTLKQGCRVGFISAVSHQFCSGCNRIRLTADGFLKTCLQYDEGVQLRPLLNGSDEALRAQIVSAIEHKPMAHHFGRGSGGCDETRKMSQIGG